MSSTAAAAADDDADANGHEPSPRRAKEIFGDCALVEIIHLHDCFRGALKNLEVDVSELCREMSSAAITGSAVQYSETRIIDLERRVAGRFTVIWSVFRAHSAAEDEFIWPALKAKQVSLPDDVCGCDCASAAQPRLQQNMDPPIQNESMGSLHGGAALGWQVNHGEPPRLEQQRRERAHSVTVHRIEQEEYEEDHADEERMFTAISRLLSNLRDELSNHGKAPAAAAAATATASGKGGPNIIAPTHNNIVISPTLCNLAQMLLESTRNLMKHLMTHLDKEETHCMPLVAQYLTKTEINDLVGKIMGKRSSELMSQILTMAIQNLNEVDRDDMVRYMKQAMVGTFFERWLKMGGWMEKTNSRLKGSHDEGGEIPREQEEEKFIMVKSTITKTERVNENDAKMTVPMKEFSHETTDQQHPLFSVRPNSASSPSFESTSSYTNEEMTEKYTSAVELEKLIRAIGTNPHLDSKQKNLTIQGLRDSVWKSNCRLSKRKREAVMDATTSEQPAAHVARITTPMAATAGALSTQIVPGGHAVLQQMSFSASSGVATRFKRETPPSSYYKKTRDGEVKLVWSR
ncbi:hypothetical protein ACHAXA_005617 [Cyclostephanos tholiformis]|uniref:Uncharacterized protein n=1 Tax=Cyclostephanos tholiformis TaxID=382380 RepID=A0ABD3SGU4_9STRA